LTETWKLGGKQVAISLREKKYKERKKRKLLDKNGRGMEKNGMGRQAEGKGTRQRLIFTGEKTVGSSKLHDRK